MASEDEIRDAILQAAAYEELANSFKWIKYEEVFNVPANKLREVLNYIIAYYGRLGYSLLSSSEHSAKLVSGTALLNRIYLTVDLYPDHGKISALLEFKGGTNVYMKKDPSSVEKLVHHVESLFSEEKKHDQGSRREKFVKKKLVDIRRKVHSKKKHCIHCGMMVPYHAKFCPDCGKKQK